MEENNQSFMEKDMRSRGHPGNGASPQTSPTAWAHLAMSAGGVDGAGTLAVALFYSTASTVPAANEHCFPLTHFNISISISQNLSETNRARRRDPI